MTQPLTANDRITMDTPISGLCITEKGRRALEDGAFSDPELAQDPRFDPELAADLLFAIAYWQDNHGAVLGEESGTVAHAGKGNRTMADPSLIFRTAADTLTEMADDLKKVKPDDVASIAGADKLADKMTAAADYILGWTEALQLATLGVTQPITLDTAG